MFAILLGQNAIPLLFMIYITQLRWWCCQINIYLDLANFCCCWCVCKVFIWDFTIILSTFRTFFNLNTGYLVQVSRVTPSKITWHLSSDGYAPDLSTFKSTLTMIKIFYWFTIIYCFNDATAALCKYTSSFITQFTRDWTFNVYSWLTLFSWNICFSFRLCYSYVEKT